LYGGKSGKKIGKKLFIVLKSVEKTNARKRKKLRLNETQYA
jgi:hypothetical protein